MNEEERIEFMKLIEERVILTEFTNKQVIEIDQQLFRLNRLLGNSTLYKFHKIINKVIEDDRRLG